MKLKSAGRRYNERRLDAATDCRQIRVDQGEGVSDCREEMTVELIHGDCLDVMKTLPECLIVKIREMKMESKE